LVAYLGFVWTNEWLVLDHCGEASGRYDALKEIAFDHAFRLSIPRVYLDIYQRPARDLAFFLRGKVDPVAISSQVRTQIQSVDAELPVFNAETLIHSL
jgi:hypothetical protein